jgi:hypothetical protein
MTTDMLNVIMGNLFVTIDSRSLRNTREMLELHSKSRLKLPSNSQFDPLELEKY